MSLTPCSVSGTKKQEKRAFLKGAFVKMYTFIGCGALSAKRTAGPHIRGYFLVSLGVTLDSTETLFSKTPSSWCLKLCDWCHIIAVTPVVLQGVVHTVLQ